MQRRLADDELDVTAAHVEAGKDAVATLGAQRAHDGRL